MPRHRKIKKISDGPRANAKPTAVPTNGAEQGVASKVANTPARKASSMGPLARLDAMVAIELGKPIGSHSKKLAANKTVSTAIPARNHGC